MAATTRFWALWVSEHCFGIVWVTLLTQSSSERPVSPVQMQEFDRGILDCRDHWSSLPESECVTLSMCVEVCSPHSSGC